MEQRDVKTLVAGETLDCTNGIYADSKVVAILPVGYGAKCCARALGNSSGSKKDYATTGVYAADGSTATDVICYTPNRIGFDKVTVPTGASPVICWMDYK